METTTPQTKFNKQMKALSLKSDSKARSNLFIERSRDEEDDVMTPSRGRVNGTFAYPAILNDSPKISPAKCVVVLNRLPALSPPIRKRSLSPQSETPTKRTPTRTPRTD